MSSKTVNFADQVLALLNKDEETVQQESVLDIISDYKIQCQTQIGYLETSTIPSLKLKLDQDKRALGKAEKALENSYLDLQGGNFQNYIGNITNAEAKLANIESRIENIENDIELNEGQVKKYKDLLDKLSA